MAETSEQGSQPVEPPIQRTRVRRVKVKRPSHDPRAAQASLVATYGLDVLIVLALILAGIALSNNWHHLFTVDTTIGGAVLLVLSITFGLMRVRYHLLHSTRWLDTSPCPRCGRLELKRTPRKNWHKVVGSLTGLPLRRYICAHCAWKGVRLDESKIPG